MCSDPVKGPNTFHPIVVGKTAQVLKTFNFLVLLQGNYIPAFP